MQGNGGVAMTRASKDQPAPPPGEPASPGGRPAERLREFNQARGLGHEGAAEIADERNVEDQHESTSHQDQSETVTPADDAGDPPPAVDDLPRTHPHPDAMPPHDAAAGDPSSD